jgi:sRNA-binding protein
LTYDQKLEKTYQWLEETYPHLFAADDYVLLDNLILRDLKIEYKNNALKKGYRQDLVIKAALSRYRESLGYLECIREGASRYNIKGETCGIVTEEEEEAAKKILATFLR